MSQIVKADEIVEVVPNVVEGFDIGNAYVNFDDTRFASRVEVGATIEVGASLKEVHQVTYNGVEYRVGTGKSVMGENKYSTDAYKILVLTAIALKGGRKRNIKAKICLGLPIENFKRKAKEVSKIVKSWGTQEIIVKDKKYTIDIMNVKFFMEGALPILNDDNSHILGIDIGGGTVNIAEWDEMGLVRFATHDASITNVYSRIAQYYNMKHGGSFKASDVEKYIGQRREVVKVNGKEVDFSTAYLMIQEFVDGVVSFLEENKFSTGIVDKIEIFGGGAYTSFKEFLTAFPHANQVEESQFVNSKIFRLVSKM